MGGGGGFRPPAYLLCGNGSDMLNKHSCFVSIELDIESCGGGCVAVEHLERSLKLFSKLLDFHNTPLVLGIQNIFLQILGYMSLDPNIHVQQKACLCLWSPDLLTPLTSYSQACYIAQLDLL